LKPAIIAGFFNLPIFQHTIGIQHMYQNETHMNRSAGNIWWYWPAIMFTSAISITVLIYLTSVSHMGAGIALMLHKLI
jgi:hypothetical protein